MSQKTTHVNLDDAAQFKNPDRVWSGPLNDIMQKSYTNGVIAGVAASGFAFGVDRFFITPHGAPRWPNYAGVLPQYRGYGWILFSLGVFQYFVEDSELTQIIDQNHDKMYEVQQEEFEYIKQLEAKKKNAPVVAPQTTPPPQVSKHVV